jgi:hypothetical protein
MNWLDRFMPSRTAARDPALVQCERLGVTPVTLEDLKLVFGVRRRIDDRRREGVKVACPKPGHLGVVVPYRSREKHLEEFIPHIHAFLDDADIRHTIIVAEQADRLPFNRGALRNIGALAAWDLCDHFVWHDVDLLPEIAAYLAFSQPTKLVRTIRSENGEELELFNHNFGGVTAVSKKHLEATNGMSNRYWGWGAEDDDFLMRCLFAELHPCKDDVGIFRGLPHIPSISTEKSDFASDSAWKKQRRRNRRYFSRMKRGLVDHNNDGVRQLRSNFQIDQTAPHQLTVKADLNECLSDFLPATY